MMMDEKHEHEWVVKTYYRKLDDLTFFTVKCADRRCNEMLLGNEIQDRLNQHATLQAKAHAADALEGYK